MKLYVIGNGFDQEHCIESDYAYFAYYMWEKHADVMSQCEFFKDNVLCDLWADFEAALGSININDILPELEDEAWKNEPEELRRQSNLMVDTVSRGCDVLMKIYETFFEEWVEQIDLSGTEAWIELDKSALFFTFNYTETLEEVYGIPKEQILHIHNCRSSASHEPLIVGHYNMLRPQYSGEGWIATDEIDNSLKDVYERTRKPVKRLIEKNEPFFKSLRNVDEVYVYGHSLNDIDMDYFHKIKRSVLPNAKWTVSYLQSEEKAKFEYILKHVLHVKSFQLVILE